MARTSRSAVVRAHRTSLACVAALLSACGLAHETEPSSSRHPSAGTAERGDDESAPEVGEPDPAAPQLDESTPALGSGPGDVSTTPVQRPATASVPDAGIDVVACEEIAEPDAAPPVTTLEATLHQGGDPILDDLLSVGNAVAIDGDTLAVTALRNASQIERGKVLVFVRSGEAWTLQAELVAPEGEPDNWFGQSLALDGDTLAVGAHRGLVGRVEVFARNGLASSFERVQTLRPERLPSAQAENDWVGPVVLDGDVLAMSVSPAVNDPGQYVQVYERGTEGWQEAARVVGDRPPETFGISMALEGHTLVVGDSYLGSVTSGGQEPNGGAYVFERACDGSWTQRALLASESENYGGNFGSVVAIDGERIAVSDPHDPTAANGIDGAIGTRDFDDDYTGAVYVFGPDGDGYARLHFLKPAEGAPRETYFGTSLAASAGRLLVGARGQDTAYVFR